MSNSPNYWTRMSHAATYLYQAEKHSGWKELPCGEFTLLLGYAFHLPKINVGATQLAEETGLTIDQVNKYRKNLRNKGWIKLTAQGGQCPSLVKLLLPGAPKSARKPKANAVRKHAAKWCYLDRLNQSDYYRDLGGKSAVKVLYALACHLPKVHVKVKTLVAECGLGDRAVRKALDVLVVHGLVEKNRDLRMSGHFAVNYYALFVPHVPDAKADEVQRKQADRIKNKGWHRKYQASFFKNLGSQNKAAAQPSRAVSAAQPLPVRPLPAQPARATPTVNSNWGFNSHVGQVNEIQMPGLKEGQVAVHNDSGQTQVVDRSRYEAFAQKTDGDFANRLKYGQCAPFEMQNPDQARRQFVNGQVQQFLHKAAQTAESRGQDLIIEGELQRWVTRSELYGSHFKLVQAAYKNGGAREARVAMRAHADWTRFDTRTGERGGYTSIEKLWIDALMDELKFSNDSFVAPTIKMLCPPIAQVGAWYREAKRGHNPAGLFTNLVMNNKRTDSSLFHPEIAEKFRESLRFNGFGGEDASPEDVGKAEGGLDKMVRMFTEAVYILTGGELSQVDSRVTELVGGLPSAPKQVQVGLLKNKIVEETGDAMQDPTTRRWFLKHAYGTKLLNAWADTGIDNNPAFVVGDMYVNFQRAFNGRPKDAAENLSHPHAMITNARTRAVNMAEAEPTVEPVHESLVQSVAEPMHTPEPVERPVQGETSILDARLEALRKKIEGSPLTTPPESVTVVGASEEPVRRGFDFSHHTQQSQQVGHVIGGPELFAKLEAMRDEYARAGISPSVSTPLPTPDTAAAFDVNEFVEQYVESEEVVA